jgi:hypothetical protein
MAMCRDWRVQEGQESTDLHLYWKPPQIHSIPEKEMYECALGQAAQRCLKTMHGVSIAYASNMLAKTLQRACEA